MTRKIPSFLSQFAYCLAASFVIKLWKSEENIQNNQ